MWYVENYHAGEVVESQYLNTYLYQHSLVLPVTFGHTIT